MDARRLDGRSRNRNRNNRNSYDLGPSLTDHHKWRTRAEERLHIWLGSNMCERRIDVDTDEYVCRSGYSSYEIHCLQVNRETSRANWRDYPKSKTWFGCCSGATRWLCDMRIDWCRRSGEARETKAVIRLEAWWGWHSYLNLPGSLQCDEVP